MFTVTLTSSLTIRAVCLWGNSTDLSLLIDMTEEQIKSLQSTGGDHLAATEKNILGNDLPLLWDSFKAIKDKQGGRVDFVLDNAGFELYCDCVYGTSLFLFQKSRLICVLFSRFLNSKRSGDGSPFPWEEISVVCV